MKKQIYIFAKKISSVALVLLLLLFNVVSLETTVNAETGLPSSGKKV